MRHDDDRDRSGGADGHDHEDEVDRRNARGKAKPRPITALRLIIMVVVGVTVALAVGKLGAWAYAPAAGWGSACLVYIVWVWVVVWTMPPSATREHASREDPGRAASDLLVNVASVASLAGVALALIQGADQRAGSAVAAVLALVSIILSWALIHTLYTLRYAREYFAPPIGGIDFNQSEQPRYSDFAYFAFTLGMTYQVSDTDISSSRIRRIALGHSLLSFLFGTGLLATTLNLIVGLVGG